MEQKKIEFEKIAMHVSKVTIIGNMLLSVIKLIAGLVAHSGAMISDAIHSASDVFSTIIVMVGIKIAAKESDEEHPYGHERLECVAAIVLATVLAVTGLGIGYKAVVTLADKTFSAMQIPGVLALIAAFLSIVCKEVMYWYTRFYAKKLESSALMADAWHHRSDALSSVGALIGIAGARMGFLWADTIASLIICLFIEKAAYDIFMDAVDKMVDKACDEETQKQLYDCVLSVEGVEGIDVLLTRVFANKIYVDLEIQADGDKPLRMTHEIAERVHDKIEDQFPKVKHIMVHVNPKEK